jgi:tRNA (guanine37-N1)-methyltransferase
MGSSWRDAADVPDEIRQLLPRGYDVVGDVAIVRLAEGTEGYEAEIGQALVESVPPAETAAVDRGVEGELRTRDLDVLAGEGSLVTWQKENGCRLKVDLEHTYFSPRLAHERARVADKVDVDEGLLDMYSGVAPYAVLVAKRRAHVLAVDANPRAVELARRNADANKVADRIDVVLADSQTLVPALEARFDHVVMNLPQTGEDHLDEALTVLAEDGRVHLGTILPMDEHEAHAEAIADAHDLELHEIVHVRNYNPALGHYTLELSARARLRASRSSTR